MLPIDAEGHQNRVVTAILKARDQVATAKQEGKDLSRVDQAAQLDFESYVAFQDVKSLAQACGVLTLAEAQTVFDALGDGPDGFGRNDLGDRIALVLLFHELLKWRMAQR